MVPSDYEPDFSASISQKIPCGSNSMFRIPFKDKNDSTKILKHQITKDGKIFTGIPELIIRQNDEDFTVVISVTSTNLENKDDLRENNFFTKSSHFTGVDYFFSPEGTSFLGANPYTNGEYNGELESITCIVICTINGGGSGGSGGVIPQSTGPARIVSVTQVKNTTTNMMTCTTSCIIGGTPTGGGSSGSNGSSGGSNIPSGGGGSGSNTPYNPPKDPTCPTGNCCGEKEKDANIPNDLDPKLKAIVSPTFKPRTKNGVPRKQKPMTDEQWKTVNKSFKELHEKSCIFRAMIKDFTDKNLKIQMGFDEETTNPGLATGKDHLVFGNRFFDNPHIQTIVTAHEFFHIFQKNTDDPIYTFAAGVQEGKLNVEFEAYLFTEIIDFAHNDELPISTSPMGARYFLFRYDKDNNQDFRKWIESATMNNNRTQYPTDIKQDSIHKYIDRFKMKGMGVDYPTNQIKYNQKLKALEKLITLSNNANCEPKN